MDHIHEVERRIVIGSLDKGWDSAVGQRLGRLNIYLEEITSDGVPNYSPINQKELFCETQKVFVPRHYDELEKKFDQNQLVRIEATPTYNNDMTFSAYPSEKQKYSCKTSSISPLRGGELVEVITSNPIEPSDPLITLESMPKTRWIMLKIQSDGNQLLEGPFAYDRLNKDDEQSQYICLRLKAPDTPVPGKSLPEHTVARKLFPDIQDLLIEMDVEHGKLTFLTNLPAFFERVKQNDHADVISNDALLRNYLPLLLKEKVFKVTQGKLNRNVLDTLRKNVNTANHFKTEKARFQQALKLLTKVEEYNSNLSKLAEEWLDTTAGQKVLEIYLSLNEAKYYERYRKDGLGKIEKDIDHAREEVRRLQIRHQELRDELNVLAQEKASKQIELDEYEKVKMAELEELADKKQKERHAELVSQIAEADKTLTEMHNRHSSFKTLEELQAACEESNNEYKRLTKFEIQQQEAVDNLNIQLQNQGAKLSEQFLTMRAAFDAIRSPNIQKAVTPWSFNSMPLVERLDLNKAQRLTMQNDYLENLDLCLRNQGRTLERESLVNIVVTLVQSQFTIFAGLPGTGKTSLVKTLGKAMGLGARQHTIPVARGWTSSKDILGFYNGLNHSFQSAPTGLWELLNSMQDEKANEVSPVLVLLDEVNLSAPEHYFSQFLDLADGESKREIYTGDPQNERIEVPLHLRFVGTVNQDHTVNYLSPRLLDRAAVIPFDEMISEDFVFKSKPLLNKYHAVCAEDWLSLFEPNGTKLPSSLMPVFQDLVEVLQDENPDLGRKVILSYRKRKMIFAYVEIAGPILVEFAGELTALDQAFLLHLLPILQGQGAEFAERLEKLLCMMNKHGLERSAKRLNNMIVEGRRSLDSFTYVA